MFIQTEATPNPAVVENSARPRTAQERHARVQGTPAKLRLAAGHRPCSTSTGVHARVSSAPDFLTVTKAEDRDWSHLKGHDPGGRSWTISPARRR